jgi:hypothetical protein
MSNRNKGFDPLSSLFDAPDPAAGPAKSEDPYAVTESGRKIQVPDPLVSLAVDAGLDLEDAPTEMAPLPPPAAELPDEPSEDGVEFIETMPAGEALPASDDWTESKPEALFSLNQLPKPDPNEELAPRYGRRMSRVERLAARAVRPVEALEAARAAARQETVESEKVARQVVRTLADRIQELIPACLPGVGDVEVANAKVMDEREVLVAIWKSHRSKFLSDGELERAVAAARVLQSFNTSPAGALVAAHVMTSASDYLVWIDLQTGSLVAAFADARSYFAG